MALFGKHSGSVMVTAIALSLAACSDSNDPDDGASASVGVDEDGASVAVDDEGASVDVDAQGIDVNTAQLALDELATNVDVTIGGFGTANPAAPPPPPAGAAPATPSPTALAVRCAAGGEAMVDGYVNVVPQPVLVDVKVAIDYNACVTNGGTTIVGSLDFSQTVAAGSVPLRVETTYTGDIQFAGKVNAKCAVDLNVLVDEAGRAIEVAGTFCGQDASTLNLQLTPHWSAQ